jgi:hypothetical protein
VEADKNMAALKKCPRCGEGRYCCQAHCNLDWDRRKLLCQDIKLKVGLYLCTELFKNALWAALFYCLTC